VRSLEEGGTGGGAGAGGGGAGQRSNVYDYLVPPAPLPLPSPAQPAQEQAAQETAQGTAPAPSAPSPTPAQGTVPAPSPAPAQGADVAPSPAPAPPVAAAQGTGPAPAQAQAALPMKRPPVTQPQPPAPPAYRVEWHSFPDGTGMFLALDILGGVFNPSEAQIARHLELKGTAKGTGKGPGPPPPSKGAGPPPPRTPRAQTVPWEGPEHTGLAPASTYPSAQYRVQYSAQPSAPSSSSAAWYAPDSPWWSWWDWAQPSWQAQDTGAEKGSGKGTGGMGTGGKGTGGKGTGDTAERPVWHWTGKVPGFKLFVGDFPAQSTAAQCTEILRHSGIPRPADHVCLAPGPLGHPSAILTYTDAAQTSEAFAQLSTHRVSEDRHLHVERFQDRHR
jgi:hypothetical protein